MTQLSSQPPRNQRKDEAGMLGYAGAVEFKAVDAA